MGVFKSEGFWVTVIIIAALVISIWWSFHEAAECAAVGGNYHPATQYQHSQCELSYKK